MFVCLIVFIVWEWKLFFWGVFCAVSIVGSALCSRSRAGIALCVGMSEFCVSVDGENDLGLG